MPEKFVEKLTEAAGRRGFLRTLSAASAAFALGLFNGRIAGASGIPCGPSLFKVGCCCLFKDPRSCTYGDCACEWAWSCNEPGPTGQRCGGKRYTCRECYSTGERDASGSCIGTVKCSKANYTSFAPCPGG